MVRDIIAEIEESHPLTLGEKILVGTVVSLLEAHMKDELVGVSDIADMVKVNRAAVKNWQARYENFPKPIARLKMGPVWFKTRIENWLKDRKCS